MYSAQCESKRDAQTMLHRDIMAAENMCRIGASFLLCLSRPNDLNFQGDDNANQNAPTSSLMYKSRLMETQFRGNLDATTPTTVIQDTLLTVQLGPDGGLFRGQGDLGLGRHWLHRQGDFPMGRKNNSIDIDRKDTSFFAERQSGEDRV